MTHAPDLARPLARLGAASVASSLLLASACSTADLPSEPVESRPSDPVAMPASPSQRPLFSSASSAVGIPFASFDLDIELLGSPYNAAVKMPSPENILGLLANIRGRGGRVMLKLSNHDHYVQNSNRTFNLDKWKQQVTRFKTVDFQSYVADGTIIGIFLIDEPEDPTNWGGQKIPPATVEAIARYSKQIWPGLTTFVRSKPVYLASTGLKFRYLDAGWAMYQSWQGDVTTWINAQVAAAKRADIGVIAGLNVLNGGTAASGIKGTKGDLWAMSASQLKSWGSILMNQSYACGFFNWRYDSQYNARPDIKSAMASLAQMAQSHVKTPCRPASHGGEPPPEEPPPPVPLPGQKGLPIPYASFDMDNALLGAPYNGSVRLPGPADVIKLLTGARTKKGRIVVQLSGLSKAVQNANGTFSLTKWKTQINRFKGINLSSYLNDGTLMGHLLINRPDDPSSWGGQRISQATLEAMAQYSKQLWPGMTTFARAEPSYLRANGRKYSHLDAGWTIYASRKGDAKAWISSQVAHAKAAGLALVVGLEVLNGGTKASGIPGRSRGTYAMSASQLRTWGSNLMDQAYVCGFVNWRYDSQYNGRSDIRSAMSYLAQRAASHARTSCNP
jgi:hypothetical protein